MGKIEMDQTPAPSIEKLLQSGFSQGACHEICTAIGEALKRHNVASISRVTGLRRESLYKSFSSSRRYHNPNLETVALVLSAMGFRLQVERLSRSTPLRSKSKLRDEVHVPAPRRKKRR